jgi:hypothetical protein
LKAQARARAGATGQAALVLEILGGSSRTLPGCVAEALDDLSAARAPLALERSRVTP